MKKMGLFVGAILLCLALCGCSGEAQPSADGLTSVTMVLDWTPNTNHTGLYVAQAQGYFAEQGLAVEIIQPSDNLAPQLVAAGNAEFGISYQEEVTFARMAGVPVISLAAVIQHNTSCFAAPQSKNIKSVADFPGKRYGGWGGEVEQALINYLMEQQGQPNSVEVINIGDSDYFAAWENSIDFGWIYYGVTGIEAELRDYALDTIYIKDIDPAFDYYTPVIIAEEGWLAQNQDTARRFMAAVSKGYQFADENPQQAAGALLSLEEGLGEEMVQAGQQWLAGQYQADAPYWGRQDEAVWQGFADWLTQRGLLAEGFVAEDAFTNEYLPQE